MATEPGDELYAGPAEEFVARRDALVKARRAQGDKEGAAEVKALRRPTVAAWAVNQVARSTSGQRDVAALVQLGDRLRDAHDALLEGRGDAAIRELTTERRALVAELTNAAVAQLGPGGEAQRDAITHTFDAAVADPEAGRAVRTGRLTRELAAPSGFGGGLVFGDGPVTTAERPERRGRSKPAAAGTEAAERAEAAELEAAERRRTELRRAAEELRRAAEERTEEAEAAAGEAASARREVARLRELLAAAERDADRAADVAERAQAAADAAHQLWQEAEASSG